MPDDAQQAAGERGDREVGAADVVREVFDAMPVPMCAIEGDPPRWVAMNAAYRETIGRSGVIGEPARQTLSHLEGQRVFEAIQEVRETGRPLRGREWRISMEAPEGGRRITWFDFLAHPEPAAGDRPSRMLFIVQDVTDRVLERQAAEERAEGAERRLEQARDVVAALQSALLPAWLPVLPRIRVGARYLVAAEEGAAGGDWFDAVVMRDGALALVVGDVVGSGVVAAAAMSQLRAVLHHELDRSGGDLAAAITGVEGLAARTPALRAATVCAALLEPDTGRLRYVTCGHPPPLLVDGGGAARYLPVTGSGPLGTGSPPAVREERVEVGEAVLLYSDGLVERPGRTLEEGAAALARVAADAAADRTLPAGAAATLPDRICQLTVELITREGHLDDVTAIAAVREDAAPPPFSAETASSDGLLAMREAFGEWLGALGAADDDRVALELCLHEAACNALEHAYVGRPPGRVRVDAHLGRTGVLECAVADEGRWREPGGPDEARGRGLMLIERLVDELVVERAPGGTTVRIRHRIGRPALLASTPATAEPGPPDAATRHLADEAASGVRVTARGELDARGADELLRAVLGATRGGTRAATVDLAGVTLLGSAGVRALFELRARLLAQGNELELRAPPGSPAAMVLEVAGLPLR